VSRDIFLYRFQRDALLACALMAAGGLAWQGWRLALSVVGGGALAGVSYRAIKGAVEGVQAGPTARPWTLVKFFTRHAILAFAAYVMLSRLRGSPLGLIAGVSAPVVAAAVAAGRAILAARRPGHPR
jgi:hypothetical protein